MGDLNPPDDDTTQPGKHKKKGEEVVPEHHETAAEDEEVGSYYLTTRIGKGRCRAFNPRWFSIPTIRMCIGAWPNAERHMGDFADARANYLKVMEYDPGSRHAKEAAQGPGGSGDCKREAGCGKTGRSAAACCAAARNKG